MTFNITHIIQLLIICTSTAFSQDLNPVKWNFSLNEQNLIKAEASIDSGWYLYSQIQYEDGPIPTTFYVENTVGEYEQIFANRDSKFIKNDYDEMFQTSLTKFYNEVDFFIQLLSNYHKKGFVEFMCCDNTKCLPPEKIYFNLNQNK